MGRIVKRNDIGVWLMIIAVAVSVMMVVFCYRMLLDYGIFFKYTDELQEELIARNVSGLYSEGYLDGWNDCIEYLKYLHTRPVNMSMVGGVG